LLRISTRCLPLAGLLFGVPAFAAEPETEHPPKPAPYQVDFEAGRVVVDTELEEVELDDHVAVRVGRYRLTSERMSLRRGPRGVEVDGSGRIAFCPCPDPPITLGFSSATIAPPTDVLVEDPTVRVGGVPILWLPYLWLRSPQRLGLLPPRFAWRGDDGFFAGSGVHVPLGSEAKPAWLDIAAGGYIKGGADVETRLESEDTTTRVRWDRLEESLLGVDARGSALRRDGAGASWQIDAVRGARGRRATLALEPAARRFDRGELAVGGTAGGFIGSVGARTDAPRGGNLEEPGALGPTTHTGFGTALDGVGTLDTSLDVRSANDPDLGSLSLANQIGAIELAGRPGPLLVALELGERVDATAAETDEGARFTAGARSAISLPLVRSYGRAENPIQHRIEPFAEAGVAVTTLRGELAQEPPSTEPTDATLVAALGGLKTTLGAWARRSGAELALSGGWGGEAESLDPLAAGRLTVRSGFFGAASEAAYAPLDTAVVTLSRLRLGPEDGLSISAYAEGRLETEPQAARFFLHPSWRAQRAGWLDRPGWTVGGALAIPWADWLASRVAADYDIEAEELLSVRGALGYRHRCGCLALSAWAGQRIGREGIDIWGTLDLLP
jgi:hypothetical protein